MGLHYWKGWCSNWTSNKDRVMGPEPGAKYQWRNGSIIENVQNTQTTTWSPVFPGEKDVIGWLGTCSVASLRSSDGLCSLFHA